MRKYIVGGFVRDTLLNRRSSDRDWVVVGADVDGMLNAGFKRVGAAFPVFLHPVTNEEYALARREVKTGARHGDFAFDFSKDITLDEDLTRRDFTVNALVMNEDGALVDTALSARALDDLKNRRLDIVDEAHFAEDPLRVFRAARYAAVLNFTMTPRTFDACRKLTQNGAVNFISKERIYAEFVKAFKEFAGGAFFQNLHDLGALAAYAPALERLFSCLENPRFHPEGTSGGHTASALKWLDAHLPALDFDAAARETVYWSVLLHDIGKTQTAPDLYPHYYGHDEAGARMMTRGFFDSLKLPSRVSKAARFVCVNHMRRFYFNEMRPMKKLRLIREAFAATDGRPEIFIAACFADALCNAENEPFLEDFKAQTAYFKQVFDVSNAVRLSQKDIEKTAPQNRSVLLERRRLEAVGDLL